MDRPVLHIYVQDGCPSCERAKRTANACEALAALVDIQVRPLDTLTEELPPGVVGVPTFVLNGVVVALGTPNCRELAQRLRAMLHHAEVEG
jgi:glutaredoxin